MRYQHKEIGWTSLGIIAAIFIVNSFFWRNVPLWSNLLTAIILAFCAFFLSSLTIRITNEDIEWWFAAGLARKKLFISDIRRVSARTIVPLGWGIRTNGRDMRYIVTGTKVIALEKHDGKRIEIGASEADKIEEILQSIISSKSA